MIHFKWKKPKTTSNNCFIIDLKPEIINMAHKTIKNKPRRLNMQITELSVKARFPISEFVRVTRSENKNPAT